VRWLLAHVWPDQPERRRRLEAAISVAQQNPPLIARGDLATDLPTVLAEVPTNTLLVVFHSGTLPYVTESHKQAFAEVLVRESHKRDVVWISNESCGALPELARIAPAHAERRFLLGRTTLTGGRREDSLLALAHPHGAELMWL
jgi:hypothetical protein